MKPIYITCKEIWEDILEIRDLYNKGLSMIKLSKIYNVVPGTIGFIVKNKTWAHI